jgi:DedD protein
MDRALLERLIGAVVLVLLFVVFVPALLDGRQDDGDEFSSGPAGGRTEVIVLQGVEPDPVASVTIPEPLTKIPAPAPKPAPKPAKPPAKPVSAATPAAVEAPRKVAQKPVPKLVQKPAPKPVQKPIQKASSNAAPDKGFAVQLGSFSSRDNAVGFASSVKKSGYPVFVVQGAVAGGSVYRVYAGPRDSRSEAEKLAGQLAKEGQSVMVVELGNGQ